MVVTLSKDPEKNYREGEAVQGYWLFERGRLSDLRHQRGLVLAG